MTSIAAFPTDQRYSTLHQERSYLLSALAAEESRLGHMTRNLESTRAKLKIAEAHQDSAAAVGSLKKAAAAVTRKLKKCRKSERAMVDNLAAVTARLRMLEQHQWRKVHFEDSQRTQQMSMYGIALDLQEMRLESPMSPAYGYPCTPYPPATYPMSPLSATPPSMPVTPMLQPQSTMGMQSTWDTLLPTPYHPRFQPMFGVDTPFKKPQAVAPVSLQAREIPLSSHPVSNELTETGRRMSLPNPPRNSWHASGFVGGIDEQRSARESIGP
jgi:hypothetical protein